MCFPLLPEWPKLVNVRVAAAKTLLWLLWGANPRNGTVHNENSKRIIWPLKGLYTFSIVYRSISGVGSTDPPKYRFGGCHTHICEFRQFWQQWEAHRFRKCRWSFVILMVLRARFMFCAWSLLILIVWNVLRHDITEMATSLIGV